jgi:4-carboxymuconolactone decarboxylase
VVAARTQCAYEIYAHLVIAEISGITYEQKHDLMNGKCPESLGPDEKMVWEIANALGNPGPLDRGIWGKGLETIGRESMMSVVHVVGFYQYVSTILNGFDVKVPDASVD